MTKIWSMKMPTNALTKHIDGLRTTKLSVPSSPIKWGKASLLGPKFSRVDIEMNANESIQWAKEIIEATKKCGRTSLCVPYVPHDSQRSERLQRCVHHCDQKSKGHEK